MATSPTSLVATGTTSGKWGVWGGKWGDKQAAERCCKSKEKVWVCYDEAEWQMSFQQISEKCDSNFSFYFVSPLNFPLKARSQKKKGDVTTVY